MLLSSIPNFFRFFGLSESSTEVSLVSVACARYRRDWVHSPRSPVRYQSLQICDAGNPVCAECPHSTGPSVPMVDVRPCFIYSRVSDALELTGTSRIACLSLSTSLHDCDNYYRVSAPNGRQTVCEDTVRICFTSIDTRQVPRNKFHRGIGASLSEACRCRANQPTKNVLLLPYTHKRLPRSHDNEFEQTRGIGGVTVSGSVHLFAPRVRQLSS
jgi:hypothetical protein